MHIARISSIMQAGSHKQVLYSLFGKQAGLAIDILLSFFLYGVGVAMLAGAGSTLAQQFGLAPLAGSTLMTLLVIGTLCLNVRGIINLISAVFAVVGLGLSQAGFTRLVGTVYPMLGIVGLVMIIAIGLSWARSRKQAVSQLQKDC